MTWDEINTAIDVIGEIWKRYYTLRRPAHQLSAMTPSLHPGWAAMFETAWLPDGFMLPPEHKFG